MPSLIENPADCKVRTVFRFLSAKDSKTTEIYRQSSEAYGESFTTDRMVREWVSGSSNDRTNMHDEDLIEKVGQRVRVI